MRRIGKKKKYTRHFNPSGFQTRRRKKKRQPEKKIKKENKTWYLLCHANGAATSYIYVEGNQEYLYSFLNCVRTVIAILFYMVVYVEGRSHRKCFVDKTKTKFMWMWNKNEDETKEGNQRHPNESQTNEWRYDDTSTNWATVNITKKMKIINS